MRSWFGVLLLSACGGPICEVGPTDAPTVLRAEVTTARPERLQVVWQTEAGESSTPLDAEPSTSHAWLLLDLAPLVDVSWQVRDEGGDEVCAGAAQTANLAPGTPTFVVDVPDATAPAYWLATISGMTAGHIQSQVAMFRADGSWIWVYADPTIDRQIIHADLTADGVRYNRFDALRETDVATIDGRALDGAAGASRRTELAHHYYVGLEGDAVAYQRADARVVDPYGCVVGDTIVEQAGDGSERVIWSAWDDLPLAPGATWNSDFYKGCKDWTHGSGLTWRAEDDTLLLSLIGTQQVVHVDRQSGATLAVFGAGGTHVVDATSPGFAIPHGARWASSGELLVFDAHKTPAESGCYLYRIDDVTKTLVSEARWVDTARKGMFLGSVRELDDGRIQCTWGSDGLLRVFERDAQKPSYELHINGLNQFGSVTPLGSLPGLSAN